MAQEHIRAFIGVEGFEIVGIYSRTQEKAKLLADKYSIPDVYLSIEEIYSKAQVDLVVITVSEISMLDVCRQCFHYPWLILMEKPIGYTLNEALELLKLQRITGAKVFVALNRRHYGSTQNLLAKLENDNSPRYIEVHDQESSRNAIIYGRPQVVADNWMYVNSIHLIDLIRVLARGEAKSVENVIDWNKSGRSFCAAKIKFYSDDIVMYQAVWERPAPWSISVSTENAFYEMRPLETFSFMETGQRKLISSPQDDGDIDFKPGFLRQAKETLKVLRGEKSCLPSLLDAFQSMSLVSQIYGIENDN